MDTLAIYNILKKEKCARCDAYVIDKVSHKSRRCHLPAACKSIKSKYCWVHTLHEKPGVLNKIENDIKSDMTLTQGEAASLLQNLMTAETRLKNL